MYDNISKPARGYQVWLCRTSVLAGDDGGGAVSTTVSGDGKLVRLKLDPAVLAPDDVDMLEDMICLATNNALDEAAGEKARLLKDITGGLPLPPGMNLPF